MHREKPTSNKLFIGVLSLIIIAAAIIFFFHSKQQPIEQVVATQLSEAKAELIKAKAPTTITKITTIKANDSLSKIFAQQQLSPTLLHNIVSNTKTKEYFTKLHPGQQIKFVYNEQQKLIGMEKNISSKKYINLEINNNTFTSKIANRDIEIRDISYSINVKKGLYKDFKQANINPKLSYSLQKIFGDKFNFRRDLHSGDTIKMLVQQQRYPGNPKVNNIILAAGIEDSKINIEAIRFNDKGHYSYYMPNGKSMINGMDRAPLKYKYISSPFSLHRMHPILHIVRPHFGVDFVAPIGTPIRATGSGRIIYMMKERGYGNIVKIKHSHHYETRYAHLLRFAKGLRKGSHVKRGQIIGYLGNTGISTGAHLHYEVRVYNIPRNPMKVKLPEAAGVSKKNKAAFKQIAKIRIQDMQNSFTGKWLATNKTQPTQA